MLASGGGVSQLDGRKILVLAFVAATQAGCGLPVVGALTLNELNTGTSIVSSATTGKGLGDHGVSLATGRDCSLAEYALRDDRKYCEERGSKAAKKDTGGLIGLLKKDDEPPPSP